MAYKAVSPQGASEAIGPDGEATYVDVRTVAEFAAARPKGRAVNVPLEFYHPKTGATYANEAFTLVIQHALDPTKPVIIGADDGERAATAAELVAAAGFTKLEVMLGGLPKWEAAGLRVTGDNRDGVSYASLLTRARRAK